MASEDAREARRAISAWLTKQINLSTPAGYANVRSVVLDALSQIDERLRELNVSFKEKYHLKDRGDLVKFYTKGGNAFVCVQNPEGDNATKLGGGDSDWDTQIVVDPWVPIPIERRLYQEIQDIVMDVMLQCGTEIGDMVGDLAVDIKDAWIRERANISGSDMRNYDLSYDEVQSVRQVYDPDRIGLWMNDRRAIANDGEPIPGIIFNDGIRPFILYRLGYTWHANLLNEEADEEEDFSYDVEIDKPILMELIDVTIPRRNTIEAVTVWEELMQHDENEEDEGPHVKVNHYDIKVVGLTHDDEEWSASKPIPLPDIFYHMQEIATMLCEVADGSSHHQDKLSKRFSRFGAIWDNSDDDNRQIAEETLSKLAGVDDIAEYEVEHNTAVTDSITTYGGPIRDDILQDDNEAYCLVRKLMDVVADRTHAAAEGFTDKGSIDRDKLREFDQSRVDLRNLLEGLLVLPKDIPGEVKGWAYSDDLALLKAIQENEYFDISKVGFSGVSRAAVVRVSNQLALDAATNMILLRYAPEKLKPKPDEVDPNPDSTVNFKEHNTQRQGGFSYEKTLVIFKNGQPHIFITLTTADEQSSPFHPSDEKRDDLVASLFEIAAQRKVAAALTKDYVVRTALSRQYDALKTLLSDA
ncbi:hypothetical protein ACN6AT_36265 (plasmid) [Streptomyces sp. JL4002]|uniref:hypothetical protein n=1 Tax=Streptomyces sp. JL4002 TaxID=3404781 RepID=UPI003B27C6DF